MSDRTRQIALNSLLVFFLCTGAAFAEEFTHPLIGSWRLVSVQWHTSDGQTRDLYGPTPGGLLVYEKSGLMSAHLMQLDLPRCGTLDRRKCSDSLARSAFDGYLGYWGRFELSQTEQVVYHIVEGASIPDWIGTSQKRFYELSGDRLTITTPPEQVRGVDGFTTLVWKRSH